MKSAQKRTHPSADRNSQPISDALKDALDLHSPNLKLLEIASGSGQHAGFLAPLFPNITFQPTEYERSDFPSIQAYAVDCPTNNIEQPLYVNIAEPFSKWSIPFAAATFDYMLNCNMMHITPWSCSQGLFGAAGVLLRDGGSLFTYGPYAVDGVLQPESNVQFDRSLKSRDSSWGVRDISDLKQLAMANGLTLTNIRDMPSNNKFLTWLKTSA